MDTTVSRAMLQLKMSRCGWQFHVRAPRETNTEERTSKSKNTDELEHAGKFQRNDAFRDDSSDQSRTRICMIVHDVYLIESPISEIDAAAAKTQECMEKASQIIERTCSQERCANFPLPGKISQNQMASIHGNYSKIFKLTTFTRLPSNRCTKTERLTTESPTFLNYIFFLFHPYTYMT